ncbi:unnamed protein product [Strongylus vulgaris]|uniref:Beta-lactamase-related domain-containing protein n=1 Tax=Strongylus vulgaris TaxID=40348 RepID=A0A3P7JW83_STRVU|nr:unnamed protein product [Strongylus vulgaris]
MVCAVSTVSGRILEPRFAEIEDVFRENFSMGLESAGASFALYQGGKLIVDLWGGLANRENGQPWTEDTMSVLFSTTKSLSAIILATVMDQEGVSYNQKISEFWPEFAQNGKENITILDVVLHQAGLPYSNEVVSKEDFANRKTMSSYFEHATPVWRPGSQTGYHALTFGCDLFYTVNMFCVNNVIRTDAPLLLDIKDLSIGLKEAKDNERVATVQYPGELQIEAEGRRDPEALRRWNAGDNEYNKRLYETWPWITTEDVTITVAALLPVYVLHQVIVSV